MLEDGIKFHGEVGAKEGAMKASLQACEEEWSSVAAEENSGRSTTMRRVVCEWTMKKWIRLWRVDAKVMHWQG